MPPPQPPTRTFQPAASYDPPSSTPTYDPQRMYAPLQRPKTTPVTTTTEDVTVPAIPTSVTAAALAGKPSLTTSVVQVATPGLEHPLLGFPDWPPLLVYFLVGFMLGLWVVGVLLYLASFPHAVGRLRQFGRFLPWRWTGMAGEWESERGDGGRGAAADGQCGAESATSTAREMHGLGITASTSHTTLASPRLRILRRRSLDLEDHDLGSARSADPIYEPLTAPLPSSRGFTSLTDTSRSRHGDGDLESGTHIPMPFPNAHQRQQLQHNSSKKRRQGFAAFLESVNVGIEWIAWRVARATHEQVRGAEEGLVLGVRNGEREGRGEIR